MEGQERTGAPTMCLIVACLLVSVSGCRVAPWERGNLARREMLPQPNPALSAFRAHVFESKEASSGNNGSAGGGCGCN